MSWVDAGLVDDIEVGDSKALLVGETMVLLVRTAAEFFAVEDQCTHDGAELDGGEIKDQQIICPRHGARFCLRTGAVLSPPAYEAIRVFATKVDAGRVWVALDDGA
jgi:3-phenylpropionate/trans-cinnamate dioxygenase ferredoxin component